MFVKNLQRCATSREFSRSLETQNRWIFEDMRKGTMRKNWKGQRRRCITFAIVLHSLLSWSGASAQEFSLEPLRQPMPEKWREPYIEFLTATGIVDIAKTVSETKFGTIGRSDSAIFRIEDGTSCIDDLCLTVIGHFASEKFVSDAMFFAGPTILGHDVVPSLLGFQQAPYEFRSEHGNVYLLEMKQGWVVIPLKK
jgi:hypothetical protein